jgi:hypothetical protein
MPPAQDLEGGFCRLRRHFRKTPNTTLNPATVCFLFDTVLPEFGLVNSPLSLYVSPAEIQKKSLKDKKRADGYVSRLQRALLDLLLGLCRRLMPWRLFSYLQSSYGSIAPLLRERVSLQNSGIFSGVERAAWRSLMAHAFYLFDLIAVLLAAASVGFMLWVFWNLTLQIKRQVRTRVTPPETTWTAQQAEDREITRGEAFADSEARIWTSDAVSAMPQPRAETFKRRFASRVVRS